MKLKSGTRSVCRTCGQPVEWREVPMPPHEEQLRYEEEHPYWRDAILGSGFSYRRGNEWRHLGATWQDPKQYCDFDHQDLFDEENLPSWARRNIENARAQGAPEPNALWIHRASYASPKAYCDETVQSYDYSKGYHVDGVCNRKVRNEEPFPDICGMHAKPRLENLRRAEAREEVQRKRENEAAIRQMEQDALRARLAHLPFPWRFQYDHRLSENDYIMVKISDALRFTPEDAVEEEEFVPDWAEEWEEL